MALPPCGFDPAIRQGLGVGNSTGLGMAPFLVRHPVLLNNWMMAREEALARVRARRAADPEAVAGFRAALINAQGNATLWQSTHPIQIGKLDALRLDLSRLAAHIADWPAPGLRHPWEALWRWGAHPEHRYMVRRAQILHRHPFAEVRDNLIAETMLPIDLMRCKLAFFGASRFDPRSDKWVRISLFQGLPYPSDITPGGWT